MTPKLYTDFKITFRKVSSVGEFFAQNTGILDGDGQGLGKMGGGRFPAGR